MGDLCDFIHHIGESNSNINRRKTKSRQTFIAALALYSTLYNVEGFLKDEMNDVLISKSILTDFSSKESHNNDKIYSLYDITSFIGWKYNEKTHQKPLKRGSAEVNLKDLFDETSSNDNEIKYGAIIHKDDVKFVEDKISDAEQMKFDDGLSEFEFYDLTEKMKKKLKGKYDVNKDNKDK